MKPSYHTACVTGGAGFIGSRLVTHLLARGLEVRVLDDLSVGRAENVPSGAALIVGSVLDRDKVAGALRRCDIVFHLAARVAIRSSFDFVVEDTSANVVGTATVLREVQRGGSVRNFLLASSMAVYAESPDGRPVREDHALWPISPYGASKLCAEALTRQICKVAGVRHSVLRLFNTYGTGQAVSPYVGVITIFCDQLIRGEAPVIFGDGEQVRDFVHVEDVVQGFLCAMDSPASGETFNVGSGVPTSVKEVYSAVRRALGSAAEARFAEAIPGELRNSVADITKARRLLNYSPQCSFSETIGPVSREIAARSAVPLSRSAD